MWTVPRSLLSHSVADLLKAAIQVAVEDAHDKVTDEIDRLRSSQLMSTTELGRALTKNHLCVVADSLVAESINSVIDEIANLDPELRFANDQVDWIKLAIAEAVAHTPTVKSISVPLA